MHTAQIRQEIIDRVLDRRGHLHLFDRLEPNETALVVIDMQPTFVAPGSPAEVPASGNCRQYPAARGCTAAAGCPNLLGLSCKLADGGR